MNFHSIATGANWVPTYSAKKCDSVLQRAQLRMSVLQRHFKNKFSKSKNNERHVYDDHYDDEVDAGYCQT